MILFMTKIKNKNAAAFQHFFETILKQFFVNKIYFSIPLSIFNFYELHGIRIRLYFYSSKSNIITLRFKNFQNCFDVVVYQFV